MMEWYGGTVAGCEGSAIGKLDCDVVVRDMVGGGGRRCDEMTRTTAIEDGSVVDGGCVDMRAVLVGVDRQCIGVQLLFEFKLSYFIVYRPDLSVVVADDPNAFVAAECVGGSGCFVVVVAAFHASFAVMDFILTMIQCMTVSMAISFEGWYIVGRSCRIGGCGDCGSGGCFSVFVVGVVGHFFDFLL